MERNDPEPHCYTLKRWCELNGISRATFYNLRAAGLAPKVLRAGRRVLVSREAAEEWRRKMERAAEGGAA